MKPLRDEVRPIIVQQGGTSSGKTYGILQHLFLCGVENANETITVVAEGVPNLKVGAYRDAQNILASNHTIQAIYPDHHKSDRVFTSVTGSRIEFISYQNTYDARSVKRDRLFINAANGVKHEIYDQLALRTTKQTIIDFTASA